MWFALVEDQLEPPTATKQRGICPGCGDSVISKCGKLVKWHWAHESGVDCVADSEPMTPWHRLWQDVVPQEWQEVVGRDSSGVVRHRADIKLPSGLVVEVQHSPISFDSIRAREHFWQKHPSAGRILWIRNGEDLGLEISSSSYGISLERWPLCREVISKRAVYIEKQRQSFAEIAADSFPCESRDSKMSLKRASRELSREKAFITSNSPDVSSNFLIEVETLNTTEFWGIAPFRWKRSRRSWKAHTAPVWVDLPDSKYMALINHEQIPGRCLIAPRESIKNILASGDDFSSPKSLDPLDIGLLLSSISIPLIETIDARIEEIKKETDLFEKQQEDCLIANGYNEKTISEFKDQLESCTSWSEVESIQRKLEPLVKQKMWDMLPSSTKKHVHHLKATHTELSKIWETVIDRLEYRSTQMLLRQHSQLARLSETAAWIVVKNPWVSSMESRRSSIEKALSQEMGRPILTKILKSTDVD